jgi:hypothetical protein
MGRTVAYVNLETRTARMRLRPGRKMYWHNIVLGRLSVGYQRQKSGRAGRWVARETLGDDRYRIAQVGIADDYSAADGVAILSFDDAKATAVKAYRADGLPSQSIVTVADAMRDYVSWLKAHRATGKNAEQRAANAILPELGKVRLAELTGALIGDISKPSIGRNRKSLRRPSSRIAAGLFSLSPMAPCPGPIDSISLARPARLLEDEAATLYH